MGQQTFVLFMLFMFHVYAIIVEAKYFPYFSGGRVGEQTGTFRIL